MAGRIAFFDVDHTLTRRSTGYRFVVEAIGRGLIKAWRLAAMPVFYVAYRLGKPGSQAFDREHAILRGIPRASLEEAAAAAFEARIANDVYPEALALVESLEAEGVRVFLATSSIDLLVRPLAERLGAAGVIASRLEFRNGVSTGRFEGAPAFGAAKLELAAAAAEREGVALADCSFYSDSVHDLPLLLAVGEPVAVNPDPRLAAEARRRGWRRLSFR